MRAISQGRRHWAGRGSFWIVCLAFIAAATLASTARADAARETIGQALQSLERGDARAALEELEEAYHQVWLKTGFHLSEMQLTAGEPTDFGIYRQRPSNAYVLGDTVFIYYEVAAFKYRPTAAGLEFGIEMDVEMEDQLGRTVLRVSRVMSQVFQANRAVKEMYLSLSIDLESNLAGSYVVKTVLRDLISGEETEGSLEILVEAESG